MDHKESAHSRIHTKHQLQTTMASPRTTAHSSTQVAPSSPPACSVDFAIASNAAQASAIVAVPSTLPADVNSDPTGSDSSPCTPVTPSPAEINSSRTSAVAQMQTAAAMKITVEEAVTKAHRERNGSCCLHRWLMLILIRRHAVLLLVPIFYFWGMLLMMEQLEVEEAKSALPLPYLQQQPASAVLHPDSWRTLTLGELLQRTVYNATSLLFLTHPRVHLLQHTGWEPEL
ncbi:hypothetical protein KP509_23G039800 [Ceratopteris richardii]|uniref:Uncharacterized protein n=1 Tax=Ceratopteris richardii TaxID=49495 RepID=A0A8T2RYX7_CERRI|nr:hypothetical protein KP509_23G039800 [Ceratopteris richardii]